MTPAVLFDLDGTLVDSAPSILEAFADVLAAHGLPPVAPLDRSLIGPPLRGTLARITGQDDPALIERLAAAFRERYDTAGVAATRPYPGLVETLTVLRGRGHRLFIVTNKRIAPTRAILSRLDLAPAFEGVYALDAFDPPAPDKGATVANVLARHALVPDACVLVGDSAEDARAAHRHAIPFIAASYGYGAPLDAGVPVAAVLPELRHLAALLAPPAGPAAPVG